MYSSSITGDSYTHVLAEQTQRRFAFNAEDAPSLRYWQQAFRAALAQHLGIPRIAARCSGGLVATRRSETRVEDHVREEWELETEPGFHMPFFLLRPLNATRPAPLVFTPHGHSPRGRFIYAGIAETDIERAEVREGERDVALQAVRQGYVVIAPEARAFGESMDTHSVRQGAKYACPTWQSRALMLGRTLIGERVWDIMRLIDFATTRQDIDTSRIAITGNSGGGTISLYAAAVDVRIGVAVPGSCFCTLLDSIGSIHHCPCNYVPGMLELGEMADVAGLIAPRPFLAVHGKEDPIFPVEATKRSFDALQRIYSVMGATERCELFIGEGGHRYYTEPVWPFVQRWLRAR